MFNLMQTLGNEINNELKVFKDDKMRFEENPKEWKKDNPGKPDPLNHNALASDKFIRLVKL